MQCGLRGSVFFQFGFGIVTDVDVVMLHGSRTLKVARARLGPTTILNGDGRTLGLICRILIYKS